MSRFQHYREQIDACRPGSDDLALPALASLATALESDRALAEEMARSQRFDQSVAAAMHDLPVPAGLAERLLAKLSAAGLDEIDVEEAANEKVALATPPRPISRRVALGGVLATSLLVLIALAIQFRPEPSRRITAEELSSFATQWSADVNNPAGSWQKLKAGETVKGFVPPTAVLQPAKSWQSLKTTLGETAVAYDVSPRLGRRAVLFVVRTKHVYPVQSLPYSHLTNMSGSVSAAAWQSKGFLYVLVIDKEGQRLDDFLEKPQVTALPWKAAFRSA
jgi:hypothetical protein